MGSLLELFVHVDDFCQEFIPAMEQQLLQSGQRHRIHQRPLSISEVMTILIHFYQSHYQHFKAYCTEHMLLHLEADFPDLISYIRFVDFIFVKVLSN